MTVTTIDSEIQNYLPLLNEDQKEAILIVMKTFAQNPVSGNYNTEFQEELTNRFAAYEAGEVQSFTLEETENRAREMYKLMKK